jgi:flagellar hook-basal body complex protein FliE
MPVNAINSFTTGMTTGAAARTGEEKALPGFGETLLRAIAQVNQLENEAQESQIKLAAGQISDIHQVMLAAEKADLALEMTLAVRNKIIEAYQEIMRMPV